MITHSLITNKRSSSIKNKKEKENKKNCSFSFLSIKKQVVQIVGGIEHSIEIKTGNYELPKNYPMKQITVNSRKRNKM